jgi:hypothetical protein
MVALGLIIVLINPFHSLNDATKKNKNKNLSMLIS